MKKTVFAILLTVVLAGSFALSTAAAPLTLRLTNVSPVGDARDLSCHKFADAVERLSKGNVKVEVFSGGTLGDWRVTLEGLKPGIVNIVLESLGTIEPYTKYAGIDPFPFLYRDEAHFLKVWQGETGKKILEFVGKDGGFKLIGAQYRGARNVNSKRKFTDAAGAAGLKIRVPQLKMYLRTWELLGTAPTPMAATEIYTGLQQGTVEAQENPLSFSYSAAYYEVCPYLIMTKHVLSNDMFILDRTFFDSLPADTQKILIAAADEAAKWRTDFEINQESEFIKKFQAKKVEVVYPDTKSFAAKVSNIIADFPYLKDIVKMINDVK